MSGTVEAGRMAQVNLDNALESGRDAVRRHAWREAFEQLTAADQAANLNADDLEGLAEAAWWNGRSDRCISARERAFSLYLATGEPRRAAQVAVDLAKDHFSRRSAEVGTAWQTRAERLLQDEPVGVEHGYLARLRAMQAHNRGEFDRALELSSQTLEIGTRLGNRDLIALALHDQGQTLIAQGEVSSGMALLDEATVAALSGELRPITTGIVYCNVIGACEEIADYKRASEWTDVARRWGERQAIAGFPGICRVHRAEVIRLQGAWQEAEQQARSAYDELRDFHTGYAAAALYEIGEIRRSRGDLVEASVAYRQAHEMGKDPNPGLALVHLAEGKIDAAVAAIHRGLAGDLPPLGRVRLLPAQVAIALAAGDRATAELATRELRATAEIYGTPALKAQALTAEGAVQLAAGESDAAVRSLCEALVLWRDVEDPYDEAKARIILGSAYRAGGDVEGAVLEFQAARSTFARLGAALDERQVAGLLAETGDNTAQPAAAATRTFMFTDIVKSTDLVAAMGDDAWNEVLRWHDQTLRGLFVRHAGEEMNHTGDGFFVGFEQPDRAIECAVQIQRTLADHRRNHGFAPRVRIGLHQTEATRVGLDYRGKGVHEAARIAAAAQGGEVLASWHTAQPCKFALSEPRAVSLKGIAEPVQVVTISWK
jgi:class 3 adenylate cyclase